MTGPSIFLPLAKEVTTWQATAWKTDLGDVAFFSTSIDQVLNVGFGEHSAPRGDFVVSPALLGIFVEVCQRDIDQG